VVWPPVLVPRVMVMVPWWSAVQFLVSVVQVVVVVSAEQGE